MVLPEKEESECMKILQTEASKQAVNQSINSTLASPRLACMPVQCFECFFSTDGDRKGNNKNKKQEKLGDVSELLKMPVAV